MRDLILLAALMGILPLIFRAPIVGLLAWIWVTLMQPQREVYGFLSAFQLNLLIAAITAIAWLMSKERKTIPLNMASLFLILFGAWTCVTTYTALVPEYSAPYLDRTLKTIVLALAVVALVNTKSRIQAVMWSIAVSLGYYAVKGGGFVLLTGGSHTVYGPDNSMISDNNLLGLALVVLLPMLNYLRVSSRLRYVRWALLATMALCIIAIIGTYSRGALLALFASVAVYALRSKSGIFAVIIAGALILTLPSVLPSRWMDRMSTIQAYDQDASFEGRIAAWKTSLDIAKARPLIGGGFSSVELDSVAQRFQSSGSLPAGKAAHSIYFQVLGDHGFVGLGLYLAMVMASLMNTFLVLSFTRGRKDMVWANQLARMLQVSTIAFLIGGAALSMAYYDGFIVMMLLSGVLLQIVRQPAAQEVDGKASPAWKQLTASAVRSLPPAAPSGLA